MVASARCICNDLVMSHMNELSTTERKIFSVSALNQAARMLLEGHFPQLWIEGEISNLAHVSFFENFQFGSSGHRCRDGGDGFVFFGKVGDRTAKEFRVGRVVACGG